MRPLVVKYLQPLHRLKSLSPRLTSLSPRWLAVPLVAWCITAFFLFGVHRTQWFNVVVWRKPPAPRRMVLTPVGPTLEPPVACMGPRGRMLDDSPDDDLIIESDSEMPYPVPFSGSHNELGLNATWMTADGRYGPYGLGEDDEGATRSRVDWDRVDWGKLQDECLARNAHRYSGIDTTTAKFATDVRFTWLNKSSIAHAPRWNVFSDTRRTALVIRAYEGFNYKAEVMYMIRSLITEASLKMGGEYVVTLLVNILDEKKRIFESRENYDKAFEEANIPPELQSIALLWDDSLLYSWYSAIDEHRTMWQVNQPLQLFALHYPEFDHYWQIELDQRFLGDAGQFLDATSKFARNEPRKQSLERATFSFSEEVYGSYDNFTSVVDVANNGSTLAWGPIRIPDIPPIGPEPPVESAEHDDFLWGVGEDADAIVTGFCADIRTADWVFNDYIRGFRKGVKTPRWWCPPAVARGSRNLLLAVHEAQHEHGLSIPSEAVIPTFALWHGLKMSSPPQPIYMHVWHSSSEFLDETVRNRSEWRQPTKKPWFGYEPGESGDGTGHADPASYADRGLTWWWTSNYPRRVMDIWMKGEVDAEDMPSMLAVREGKVYAPNFAMHPVKT